LWANTLPDVLCQNVKISPLKGRGFRHVTIFKISGPPLYLWNDQR